MLGTGVDSMQNRAKETIDYLQVVSSPYMKHLNRKD
jgi:hypothetical protein